MMKIGKKEIHEYSVKELAALYRTGELSPTTVTEWLLKRIGEYQTKINAFVTVTPETAMAQAKAAEIRFRNHAPLGILDGIPYCAKDLIYTKGIRTTMGASMFRDFVPDENAVVIDRLNEAGAVLLGKANTQQFAIGATGEVSCAGPCRNPYNPAKISGGSSSGSAAAVGAKLCPFSLGTDTGGSVRAPASYCGVVGIRPTFGRISTRGIFPNSDHFDSVGILTRNAEDNAIVMNVLAGYDRKYQYSLNAPEEDFALAVGGAGDLPKIGVPYSFFTDFVSDYVRENLRETVEKMQAAGWDVTDCELPDMSEYQTAMSRIHNGDLYSVHKPLLEQYEDIYPKELIGRLDAARAVQTYEYAGALKKQFEFRLLMEEVFSGVDLLMLPTQPTEAFDIGSTGELVINGKSVPVFAASSRPLFIAPFGMLPAISIPCGFHDGLPLGLQLIGPYAGESGIYGAADRIMSLLEK